MFSLLSKLQYGTQAKLSPFSVLWGMINVVCFNLGERKKKQKKTRQSVASLEKKNVHVLTLVQMVMGYLLPDCCVLCPLIELHAGSASAAHSSGFSRGLSFVNF